MSHNELIKLNEKEMVLNYMYAVLNINHYEHLSLLSTYFLFSLFLLPIKDGKVSCKK